MKTSSESFKDAIMKKLSKECAAHNCRKRFIPQNPGQKYHTKECFQIGDKPPILCPGCQTKFYPPPPERERVFCTDKCKFATWNKRIKAKAEAQKIRKQQREKLKPKIPGLMLHLRFKIFMRDNFTCQYCGRNVGMGARLQIDHIHPQSHGGTWEESNLTTACRECNIGKSDVILEKKCLKS